MKLVYLVTEGVHDVAFLGKILKNAFDYKKTEVTKDLEPAWLEILPSWPHNGSLRASVPSPTFYQNASTSVALTSADGIDKIEPRLAANLTRLNDRGHTLDAVGVVLDADYQHAGQKSPSKRFEEMADVLGARGLPRPVSNDVVLNAVPRTGIYVLPGNSELGTLEDILLECGAMVYPTLGCRAVRFVDGLDRVAPDFKPRDLKQSCAPSGRNKAVIAAMTAVLKPGKAVQASIEDDRWIEPRTLKLARVARLVEFIRELVGAPSPT